MTYLDRYGRIHDNAEATSNNSWFYSSVYHKLGGRLNLDLAALKWCYDNLERHPYAHTRPPLSRDEWMGLCHLMKAHKLPLTHKGWNYSPYKLPAFNPISFLLQAIKLVDWKSLKLKHRNTFWQEGLWQIGHVAFSVPWSDRYTILRINGKYSLFWMIIHYLLNRKTDNRSGRQLYWFKTGKDIEGVINYHPPDSPIHKLAKEKRL